MKYFPSQFIGIFSFFVGAIFFCGCSNQTVDEGELPVESFTVLHIGHTRSDVKGKIPELLNGINYDKYAQLCHGGDVDINTSSADSIIAKWNALFHFDLATTHLSLGNHDTANRDLISQYTQRPSFYAHASKGITYLVLDTQLDSSRITGEQLELVNAVCDTISESGALIVLTHKLLWMVDNGVLQPTINDVVNYIFGNCNSCTQPNNFYADVYPRLVEVHNQGISVICIAGDIGDNSKEFQHQTDEGIHLLASGIDWKDSIGNKVLLLEYTPSTKQVIWEFEDLENL